MLIVFKPNGKPTMELWQRLQEFGTIAVTDLDSKAIVTWKLYDNLEEIIDIIEEYADKDAVIAI